MATPPMNVPSPGLPPSRPGWWSRNWKWFVPAGCLTVILLIAAFVGAIVLIVFGSMKQADVYKQAVAQAQSDPAVAQKLGSPIETGMFLSGNINVNGPSGEAKIEIPIHGPKAKGTIYVEATKSAGKWSYSLMQVAVEGEDTRIDLLHDSQEQ
jgi:Cytochrome oxidase complex assembly protein 1